MGSKNSKNKNNDKNNDNNKTQNTNNSTKENSLTREILSIKADKNVIYKVSIRIDKIKG